MSSRVLLAHLPFQQLALSGFEIIEKSRTRFHKYGVSVMKSLSSLVVCGVAGA